MGGEGSRRVLASFERALEALRGSVQNMVLRMSPKVLRM